MEILINTKNKYSYGSKTSYTENGHRTQKKTTLPQKESQYVEFDNRFLACFSVKYSNENIAKRDVFTPLSFIFPRPQTGRGGPAGWEWWSLFREEQKAAMGTCWSQAAQLGPHAAQLDR